MGVIGSAQNGLDGFHSSKAQLSAPRRQLIELMQRINFGRIEGLRFKDGEPLFDPTPRIVRDVKLCGETGPRREIQLVDFVLKAEVQSLFAHLDEERDGLIESLAIQNGLPTRMQLLEVTA